MKRVPLLVLGLLLLSCAPAYAHVTVSAPGAVRGGSDQLITFRVPVEEARHTVGFTVAFPTSTPIASVLVLPTPGWKYTVRNSKLAKPIQTDDGPITDAVSTIRWTATGGGLAQGEFGQFTVLAGQLPDASVLTFKALQTYSDGSVVKWIETAAPGSTAEPEHPAPTLSLTSSTAAPAKAKSASTTGATVLSIIALALAAAALGLGVVNRARRP